ncbi:hypothetical protein ACFSTC_01710 [Nonomuraea ferruginea]
MATPTPTTPTPTKTKAKGPNVSGCYTRDDGEIFTYGDGLPGVITGDGEIGVVISYENNGNVCTWRPLSDRLVAAGYRVLLYARKFDASPEDTALAMARRLAKKGAERVFFAERLHRRHHRRPRRDEVRRARGRGDRPVRRHRRRGRGRAHRAVAPDRHRERRLRRRRRPPGGP